MKKGLWIVVISCVCMMLWTAGCTDKKPVVVAFDANGLKSVSEIISKKVPNAKIIICADNDCYHENNFNPGVEKAREAALSIGAQVVIPKFKDTSTHPTGFLKKQMKPTLIFLRDLFYLMKAYFVLMLNQEKQHEFQIT